MTRPFACIFVGTAAAVAVVIAVSAVRPGALATPTTMKVEDFGAYWTGTKVHLAGHNAYDPPNLLPLQVAIEPDRTEPVAAWSPPWTFAVLAPFAPLDFATARWVWRFIQIGSLLAAVTAVWRAYGGPSDRLLWGWMATLGWYPTLQVVGLGQHSTVVLLGVAGWFAAHARGWHFAAGACLALVLVKPQNLCLFGLLYLVWALDRRAWRELAGGLAAGAVLSIAAAVPNPAVFADYFDALLHRPPSTTLPPTVGMFLRLAFGAERFWLVLAPTVAGIIWCVWYYARHRHDWDWREQLPVVLFASYLVSPYGWVYDQVLFLIPAVQLVACAAARRPAVGPVLLAGIAGLTVVCYGLHAAGFREITFVWLAPLTLVLYLLGRRVVGGRLALQTGR